MIDLVCIDVDGTLVGATGHVSPAVWDAAARLRETGVRLAICSGRPAFGVTREYAERLDPEAWHIFQNGASVLNLGTGDSLSTPLAPESVALLVGLAMERDLVLELYGDKGYVVERDVERARRHAGLLGTPFGLGRFAEFAQPIVRGQWLLSHAERDRALDADYPGLHVSPSLSPMMPDSQFVSITPEGIDKASAVRSVAAAYGIPLSRVMMVGDGANDATAMQQVGFPIAMANAEPEALAAASRVVGHVEENGLVEAFEIAMMQ